MTDIAQTAPATGGRPWHLWVVGIVSLLWNAMGGFDYIMTQTRNEAYMAKFTPEQLEFFYGFPAWVEGAWAMAVWSAVAGSVLLLLANRWAVTAFIISIVSMVLTTVHNYILSNGMEIMGGAGPLAFTIVIWVISILLLIYAQKMAANGTLK